MDIPVVSEVSDFISKRHIVSLVADPGSMFRILQMIVCVMDRVVEDFWKAIYLFWNVANRFVGPLVA